MAYSTTMELVQGDTLPQIIVTLKDSSEAATGQTLDPEDSSTFKPINLTGASITLKIREIGATSLTDTLAGALTDATNGEAAFYLGASTFVIFYKIPYRIEIIGRLRKLCLNPRL